MFIDIYQSKVNELNNNFLSLNRISLACLISSVIFCNKKINTTLIMSGLILGARFKFSVLKSSKNELSIKEGITEVSFIPNNSELDREYGGIG